MDVKLCLVLILLGAINVHGARLNNLNNQQMNPLASSFKRSGYGYDSQSCGPPNGACVDKNVWGSCSSQLYLVDCSDRFSCPGETTICCCPAMGK